MKTKKAVAGTLLRERLTRRLELKVSGFESSARETPVVQYTLDSCSSELWYNRTRQRLFSQIGKGYFPVYRFADGEAYFCLGYRMPPPPPGRAALPHYIKSAISAYVKYRSHRIFRAGAAWRGYGYEIYRGKEWLRVRALLSSFLRVIAEEGMIAANFSQHRGYEWMDRYIPDIYDWFDQKGIHLDEANYIPFYFVYALLLGPDRHAFLRNRKVLVITSYSEEKERRLRKYFDLEGVRSVNFIGISRSSSMTDRIELRPEHEGTEIVLIGAGVGAANILCQVKPLGALSIDAGYVLECYQDPSYKGTRVFTLPDEDLKDSSLLAPSTLA